ncbi:homeobox KN domain-containing protein [Spinellus fusiger]|nr:homeobox KN domain-containing protein [Spinellus fusiger]
MTTATHPSIQDIPRLFSPVVLFHDHCLIKDDRLLESKKAHIEEMLRTNSRYWSHIIQSTRSLPSPPHTPPHYSPSPPHLQLPSQYTPGHSPCEGYYKDKGTDDWYTSVLSDETEELPIRKRRGNLPKHIIAILKQWLTDHCNHPYPTEDEKVELKAQTHLTLNQISNWFINARRRHLPLILVNVQSPQPKRRRLARRGRGRGLRQKKKRLSIEQAERADQAESDELES